MPRAHYSLFGAMILVVGSMLFGHASAQLMIALAEPPKSAFESTTAKGMNKLQPSIPSETADSAPLFKVVPLPKTPSLAAPVEKPVDPTPKGYVPGGLMYIDTVLFKGRGFSGIFAAEALVDTQGTIEVNGWALDTRSKDAGASVELVFASPTHMLVVPTERVERPDLVNVHNNEKYKMGGFSARMGVEGFQIGEYRLYVRITCTNQADVLQLPTDRRFIFRQPSRGEEEF